jgi:beta-galactosidase
MIFLKAKNRLKFFWLKNKILLAMNPRIHKIIFLLSAIFILSGITGSGVAAGVKGERKVISLNGIWQIAEGGMEKIPSRFDHSIVVPGLLDMAEPSFKEPGPKVSDRSAQSQKDPLRDAFWYRRTFSLSGPIEDFAQLRIGKAMYGTRVFLNGKLIGDHVPCFTQGLFDVKDALKVGENELIVRVGADRNAVSKFVESGTDGEKRRFIPGIYDDVEIIMSGLPHITNIQAVPDINKKSVTVYSWVLSSPSSPAAKLHITVREALTHKTVGESDLILSANPSGNEQTGSKTVAIRGCHLWTPEDPFLYELVVSSAADNFITRFGMRTFSFDASTGYSMLNGKPYSMRGTNVTLLRFFEDSLRGNKPWNEEWIRLLFKRFHDMHWNCFRLCIGFAPEIWYRIADETGFLIQDEYPVWWGVSTRYNEEILAPEFREWMQERWNHSSVVIWDACNETYSPETGKAVARVRGLDLSNRPWQNGWGEPGNNTDPDECHPYHFVFGPDQPFRLPDMVRDTGTKAGLMIAQPFENEKLARNNPIVINEYGAIWVNRDGSPTTLSKPVFDYLMEPSATVDQRRELYARYMAAITEHFRAHRKVAAVMHFCGLGYSRPDGQTTDEWLDVDKLTWNNEFYKYVRDAFAPVGIMLNIWSDECEGGKTKEFPVIIFNDLEKTWKGDVNLRLYQDGKIIFEKTIHTSVAGFGTARVKFNTIIPDKAADYLAEASLINTPAGDVHSLRNFSVLSPEQIEARRNLAKDKPVRASSVLLRDNAPRKAEYAVDGNRSSNWISEKGNPQWLAVDLGSLQPVSRVELAYDWGVTARSFLIQTSADGDVWKTIYSTESEALRTETIRFPTVQTRWIRLFYNGPDNGDSHSIYEFAVYH